MIRPRQVLFIQGGGEGTHDHWDAKLVGSLRRELGEEAVVLYPEMPSEEDPTAARWLPAIRKQLNALEDGAVVVGHSVGGAILAHALADERPKVKLGAIILIAAPFIGSGGWPGDEFEIPTNLETRLGRGVPVELFHGLDDEEVPPGHAG